MSKGFDIAGRQVGLSQPPFVIAEIAQAHDGSLGTAHAYIDAVADAGVDAVKFQTHIASAESTPGEPWRVRFSSQDVSRYEYWKRMEFGVEQWLELKKHADARKLIFLSSAFSEEAVDLLERIGMPAWKIGSGEVSNYPLIKRMEQLGKPILISSGMSSWQELDEIVSKISVPFAIFQCTSSYPCPPEKLGLNLIHDLKARYQVPVGLSDHSAVIYSGLAAISLGANLLEVHVVFDRRCFGPDTNSSLTIDELKKLVEGVNYIHTTQCHPVNKDALSREMQPMKRLFEKSLVLRFDAPIDHVLQRGDLTSKKPGTGIAAAELDQVIGRRLRRPVPADVPLTEEDLDDAA